MLVIRNLNTNRGKMKTPFGNNHVKKSMKKKYPGPVIDAWNTIVDHANQIRNALDYKPASMKKGYQRSPGGILNAYREGDLTFDEARTELIDLNQAQKWISVKDRMPEDGQVVLTYSPELGQPYRILNPSCFAGKFPAFVTHWISIPEPRGNK